MRMLSRAAVATVAAGSLMFLGAGAAHADDKGDKKADKADKKVSISIKDVTQVCTQEVEKQKIDVKDTKRSDVGNNFTCTQVVSVG